MKPFFLSGIAAVVLVGLFAAPSFANPEGAIIRLHFQDTGERGVVMGASQRGLVFIGEDLNAFRAFRSEALGMEGRRESFVWIQDVDDDNDEEYAFAGNPSFVLDQGADPYFGILSGCDDFYLENTIDTPTPEVFCRHNRALTVFNYDGQFLWEYSVSGMRLGDCYSCDADGDGYTEMACEVGSDWILADIANDEPITEMDSNPCEGEVRDQVADWVEQTASALQGGETFDLDGDGDVSETLMFNDGTLSLMSGGGAPLGSVTISDETLYSIEVADLNGDGTPELFVGGVDTIYVISPTGELLSEVSANPERMERTGRVSVESVGVNGLEDDSRDAAMAVVQDELDALNRCYNREMGDDQFIRVGIIYYELTITDSGRVSRSQKIHSNVNSEDLEECVEGVLEDLRFSAASGDSGSASVRLSFEFTDQ